MKKSLHMLAACVLATLIFTACDNLNTPSSENSSETNDTTSSTTAETTDGTTGDSVGDNTGSTTGDTAGNTTGGTTGGTAVETATSVPSVAMNKKYYQEWIEFKADGTGSFNDIMELTYTYENSVVTITMEGSSMPVPVNNNTFKISDTRYMTKITNTNVTDSVTGIWVVTDGYFYFTDSKYIQAGYCTTSTPTSDTSGEEGAESSGEETTSTESTSKDYYIVAESNYTYDKTTHVMTLTNGKYTTYKNLTDGVDELSKQSALRDSTITYAFSDDGTKLYLEYNGTQTIYGKSI